MTGQMIQGNVSLSLVRINDTNNVLVIVTVIGISTKSIMSYIVMRGCFLLQGRKQDRNK